MSNQSNIQIGKNIENKQDQGVNSGNNFIWWVLGIIGGGCSTFYRMVVRL